MFLSTSTYSNFRGLYISSAAAVIYSLTPLNGCSGWPLVLLLMSFFLWQQREGHFRARAVTCERRGLSPQEVPWLGHHRPSPCLKEQFALEFRPERPAWCRFSEGSASMQRGWRDVRNPEEQVHASSVRVKQNQGGKPLNCMLSKTPTGLNGLFL